MGFLAIGRCSAQGEPEQSKPNFVFILSDDQDWTGLSVQMHPDIPNSKSDFYRTPNLEILASEGMRFSSAYAPAPVCSPTRVSIQTGKSPAQLHWCKAAPVMTAADDYKLVPPHSEKHISAKETTIAEMLKSAGYTTAHFGKWHLGGGGPGAHGYDVHDGDTSNKDAAPFVDPNPVDIFGMSRRANAFMEESVKGGRPFYVQLSYHALHYPENSLKSTQETYRQRTPGKMHKDVERAAMTENLDAGVGLLMKQIDALGITDNTYVIYMSDNGAGGGSNVRPLRGGKGSLFEGGIRVPLIVRGPGVKASAFCDVPVVGYDVLPTLCALGGADAPLPEGVEGGNFAQLFTEGAGVVKRPREGLVFHFPHYQSGNGPHSVIRLGDYKLVKFYETGELRLFDLAQDIGEHKDLAQKMPDKVTDLHLRLQEHLEEVNAQFPTPNADFDPNKVRTDKRNRRARDGRPERPQR
ncbi:MAG: sulfatase [bacterium]|nr:sulfatase [bacterium]